MRNFYGWKFGATFCGDGEADAGPPDNTAPVLSSATDATNGHDAYTGTVTTDEAGGILYHVATTSSTAPTAAQVVAGNDHTGSPAVQTGANAVGATGVRNVSGSGLSPETAYYIHYAQRDGGANLSNVASGNGFTTEAAPDVTGPTLSSASSAKDGHDAYTGSISTNETGTLWHIKTATATPASIAAIKAGTEQSMGSTGVQNVSGSADPATTYYLQFYAEDASDNGSNIVVSSAFTTDTSPDVTAPTLSSATDAKNGDTASTGSVSTNEGNGTLYWVITTATTSPTAAQVKAGNDHTGSAAADSDSQAVSGTGVQNMAGSGLAPETGYYTHFMHEDVASNQSAVATASGFTTDATPDTTDPVIDSVSFDEANDEIDLTFTEANLPVTVYWQVRAVATGAPNQAAMIANTGGLDGGNYTVASSPDSESIDLSALSDGDYTLYVMLKDPSDNYSTISDDDFTLTTPDVTAPTLSSATDAADGSTASTGSVSTNEANGTLYWVVTTSGTAPSAAQVKAGQDNSGAAAADSGSETVSATGVQSMSASGLTASTGYTTHFMHEDAASNQSSVASASGFTTASGASAPSITGVPTISGTETEGQTLTATAASVTGSPSPTRTWQWERSGTPISGATSSTYTLVTADVGETLTVVQTETNTEGSGTAESTATGTIAAASSGPSFADNLLPNLDNALWGGGQTLVSDWLEGPTTQINADSNDAGFDVPTAGDKTLVFDVTEPAAVGSSDTASMEYYCASNGTTYLKFRSDINSTVNSAGTYDAVGAIDLGGGVWRVWAHVDGYAERTIIAINGDVVSGTYDWRRPGFYEGHLTVSEITGLA